MIGMTFRVSEVELTAERARSLLNYDPDTGVLRWRDNRPGTVKAGDAAGTRMKNGYLKVGIDGREYLCHRVAWLITHGAWPEHQLDHDNGKQDDNRLLNLRPATNAENHQNLGVFATNTSGHPGVTWWPERRQWAAQICINGRKKSLGYFDCKEDAIAARKEGKARFHEFQPTQRGVE